jgi:DNA-binding transcriptional LysR family regulator
MQGKTHPPVPAARIRWDDVELFLALLRGGSLQVAGRALAIDASTASRRLVALEQAVGVALFARSRDGLAPTVHASELRPYAEAMEVAASSFAHGAEVLERLAEGAVRVTCPPGLADAFVLPALPGLKKRYPGITVEIDAQIGVVDLARRQADLALRTIRPTGADLVAKKVFATQSVVAGQRHYVRKLGRVRRWSDAAFVQLGASLAHIPHAQWLAHYAPDAQIAMVANTFPTQIAAACRGLGLAVMPKPYVAVYDLVEVEVTAALAPAVAQLPVDELWMVAHQAVRPLPRVAAVWQFLDQMFASYESGAR